MTATEYDAMMDADYEDAPPTDEEIERRQREREWAHDAALADVIEPEAE